MPNEEVRVEIAGAELSGDLDVPENPKGLIVFVHGGGSSRNSPRNRFVAHRLEQRGFATLLFDLLTLEEDQEVKLRRDVDLKAQRLSQMLTWVGSQRKLCMLPLGLYGSSTGAAVALRVASGAGRSVRAIVARGGRTDLAQAHLSEVLSPTLLIAGGYDSRTIAMNEAAMHAIPPCTAKRLRIVLRATKLFEEPGALDTVAKMAGDWFEQFCSPY